MKIVNITDIEDLISAKLEIDKYLLENDMEKEKMTLEQYMTNYVVVNNLYMDHGKNVPFSIIKLDKDHEYLYITENYEKLINILKGYDYDLTKLKQISMPTLISNYENVNEMELFVINNKYYKV